MPRRLRRFPRPDPRRPASSRLAVVTLDTVQHAAATPDHPQPYRELGLKDDEYQRIRDILGRRPTDA